ncbi:MAG: seg [Candidatus Wolfebacteria bacterium GW2011_GWC1_43_10]|uniref:Seg n=1 Tax=Candidatus Wolfebacteria bacterium GW2011_GWC1_43_10 TaxID=1619011 RepID=A0A0G1EJ44_9BACT|nr:MAG: seg [Candidatus Wolfebacteria bacterium GW2011_GWC1_43_10]KKT23108.1 MAG: hypothetical protein UW08_C0001G0071 [Parcubacteria group bacterium GW2011_GWB1_43_8b]
MSKKSLLLAGLLLVLGVVGVLSVFAQGFIPGQPPPPPVPVTGPTTIGEGVSVFVKIVQWIYTILFIVAVLFILISAYYFITSKGDTEKTGKAKQMLIYAVIGIVVALLSYTIVYFVQRSLSSGGGLL